MANVTGGGDGRQQNSDELWALAESTQWSCTLSGDREIGKGARFRAPHRVFGPSAHHIDCTAQSGGRRGGRDKCIEVRSEREREREREGEREERERERERGESSELSYELVCINRYNSCESQNAYK